MIANIKFRSSILLLVTIGTKSVGLLHRFHPLAWVGTKPGLLDYELDYGLDYGLMV